MPPEEALRARNRFVGWLRWYIATHPEVAPTPAALARRIGVSKGALHLLMDPKSQRLPRLETILAVERLTGFPVNVLLHADPPSAPRVP